MTNNAKFTNRTINRCDLRSEFAKLLTEENVDAVFVALRKAVNMKAGDAINLLAKLTYCEETAKEAYGQLGLTDIFPIEERLKLRDEIRYQYQRYCKWFIQLRKDQLSEAGKAAYDALEKASDTVSAFIILRSCERAKYKSPEQYNATLWHLDQKDEQKVLTGLKYLERDENVKAFMLPFASCIHNLYKTLCEEYTADCEAKRAAAESAKNAEETGVAETDKNYPMAGLSDKLKAKGYVIPEASQSVSIPAEPVMPQKFSEIVLCNKELFKQFIEGTDLNVLVAIATKFNLDPNQLMARKQDIEVLLAKSIIVDALAGELASFEETLREMKGKLQEANVNLSEAADALDA